MSEENNTGQDQTQNDQTEESTSQNEQQEANEKEYYKAFSKDEWKSHQDGFYKNAYNEGKNKALKDFQSIGIEAESYEDALGALKDKLSPKEENENKGEIEQLREQLQAIESEKEQYANQLEKQRLNMAINSEAQEVKSELNGMGELKLGMDKIQRLFEMEHDYNQENGSYYVSKDGVPVLDDKGNRKSVANALKDFIVNEQLITPSKKGVGGGTGSAPSSGSKPKFSEFQELLKSGKKGDRAAAAEMRGTAKDIGWDEEDNPKTYRRGRY